MLNIVHWPLVLEIIFTIYAIWAIWFIIMDEREPATAMAWIFFVILAPVVGIGFYIFFGRNLRVVRRRDSQQRQKISAYLEKSLQPWIAGQPALVKKLAADIPSPHARLLQLNASASTSLLTANNAVEILQNGAVKFPRLKKDLASAQKYINMAYFIWGDDVLTREIADILVERAKAGVKVKLLYDTLGSTGYMNGKYKQLLRSNGIEIYGARSLNSIANFTASNNRNHTKVVIIDGRIGYNGGMNMAEEYVSGGKKYDSWRDTQIRIEGDGVVALQAIFALNWAVTRKELLDASYFEVTIPKSNPKIPVQSVYSSPYTTRAQIKMMYTEMITAAQKQIRIQSPYFIPDASLIDALRNAALAGVDVKIMITGVPDKKSVLAAGFSYFHPLLRAGVQIYLYQAGFLHSKTLSIDSEVCTIGSANFDSRSFNLNFEATTLVYSAKVARQFEADFEADMKKSQHFTASDWQKISIPRKFYMALCRLASPLL